MGSILKSSSATKPASQAKYVMPAPPAVVVWRNCIGGDSNYAIVTKYGRSAISVLIFPTDSRVGVPKDGVRFADDPLNKNSGNSESGVWEYTEESKQLMRLVSEASREANDGK